MQSVKLATGETLAFDEAAHLYTIDGSPCPGTHALMERHGIVKPLDQWGAPYAERGKRIHLLTQLDDENDLDETSIQDLDRPYLEAWRRFSKENAVTWTGIEQLVGNAGLWYATIIDRIGTVAGRECIVNIKTGNVYHKPHAVQLALEGILTMADRLCAVYLSEAGEFEVKWYEDDEAVAVARSIAQANGYARKYMATRKARKTVKA